MPRTLVGKAMIVGLILVIGAVVALAATRAFTSANLLWLGLLALLLAMALAALDREVSRPLRELADTLRRQVAGEQPPSITPHGTQELADVQQGYQALYQQLSLRLSDAAERERALTVERDELRAQVARLEQSRDDQRAQAPASDQLSAPILPVLNGVLVAPIVGIVDELRADFLQKALLEAIQSQRARVAILDLTGLISVDPFVIKTLLQSAQSAKLLGAQPIIVGITPEVAEVLVQLGLQLREIMIMADLQAAVSFARTFIYKSRPAGKPGA